jgi:hypothetical protein
MSDWVGWVWDGKAWQPVCSAPSLGACSRRLVEEAEARGIHRNVFRVMTGGARPPWIPGKARQKAPAAPEGGAAEADDFGAG